MTDPLDALRLPAEPVDPDPSFAARLRARLRRELLNPPRGETAMTATATAPTETAQDTPLHTVTPRLSVSDARAALEFYARAFGAARRGEPYVEDDGRIGHAELALGDSVLMLADEWPEDGLLGPRARGGVSLSLHLRVAEPDATVQAAVALGAELERPVADEPYGRAGVVIDPFGHRWQVVGGAVRGGRTPGDLGYASLWVPDVERAAAFFSHVLGWTYYGHGPEHRMVEGADPHHGIVELAALPAGLWDAWPRHATLFASHAVEDVHTAVARVRAAGGQATEPHEESYGPTTECLDDQGMPFAIYQDTPATVPASSPGHGQLAYLTFEVADSARARAFFGAVFGWRFAPGHVADGWQIQGMTPIGGISGGHAEPTIVPMYTVDDIASAVDRVREAGGRASDPEVQPYGTMSYCADDQGTRFYLGELA
jgi:uncharacterized glyoxalase superfamily protein PhnB